MKQWIVVVVMIVLAGCAGAPRLPECHGRAVPINADTLSKEGARGSR